MIFNGTTARSWAQSIWCHCNPSTEKTIKIMPSCHLLECMELRRTTAKKGRTIIATLQQRGRKKYWMRSFALRNPTKRRENLSSPTRKEENLQPQPLGISELLQTTTPKINREEEKRESLGPKLDPYRQSRGPRRLAWQLDVDIRPLDTLLLARIWSRGYLSSPYIVCVQYYILLYIDSYKDYILTIYDTILELYTTM